MDFNKIAREEKETVDKMNDLKKLENDAGNILNDFKLLQKKYEESDIIVKKIADMHNNVAKDFKEFFENPSMKNAFRVFSGSDTIKAKSPNYEFTLELLSGHRYLITMYKGGKFVKEYTFYIIESKETSFKRKNAVYLLDNFKLHYNGGIDGLRKQIQYMKEDIENLNIYLNNLESIEFVFKFTDEAGIDTECKNISEVLNVLPNIE